MAWIPQTKMLVNGGKTSKFPPEKKALESHFLCNNDCETCLASILQLPASFSSDFFRYTQSQFSILLMDSRDFHQLRLSLPTDLQWVLLSNRISLPRPRENIGENKWNAQHANAFFRGKKGCLAILEGTASTFTAVYGPSKVPRVHFSLLPNCPPK